MNHYIATIVQAPPRADVVKSLKNGIVLNILGMGAAILGMQTTVGLLVAKALTTSTVPYYQGIPPGQSPVLVLDVFLVQVNSRLKILFSIAFCLSCHFVATCLHHHLQCLPANKIL